MEPYKLLLHPPGNGQLDLILRDEMGKLWTRLETELPEHGATVAVTAPSPGVGASTVAVALARFLSDTLRRKTSLLEADFRRPGLGRALSRRDKGNGLFELLTESCLLEEALHPVPGRNLTLIPAGVGAQGTFFPSPEALGRVLNAVRETHRFVVLDCPALGLGAESHRFLEAAHAAILVAQADRTKLESLEGCVRRIEELGTPLGAVVLNQAVVTLPGLLSALF